MDEYIASALLFQFYKFCSDDMAKVKRWQSYPEEEDSCILTYVVGRGKNKSEWSGAMWVCDKCLKAKRPCVEITEINGVETLCFPALPKDDRGEATDWRQMDMYVR